MLEWTAHLHEGTAFRRPVRGTQPSFKARDGSYRHLLLASDPLYAWLATVYPAEYALKATHAGGQVRYLQIRIIGVRNNGGSLEGWSLLT